MTTEQQPSASGSGAPNLVDRVKAILLQPRPEWDRIANEPVNVGGLYTGYVLPLAGIAALAYVIGAVVFGYGIWLFRVPVDPITAIIHSVLYVLAPAFFGVFFLALVANFLAPNFASQPDMGRAQQLSTYSYTPIWIAGLLYIIPGLSGLAVLLGAIYGGVLLYIGLPRMMKTPSDKRVGYFVAMIVVSIVLALVVGAVVQTVSSTLPVNSFGFGQTQRQEENANVQLPGGGSINVGDLQRQAEQMQQQIEQGANVTLDPAAIQALLPEALPGGFARSSISSTSSGAGGMSMAQAEAEYTRANDRIQVSIIHMGAASGLATMGAAMGLQSSREDTDGYSRTSTVDGRTVTEELSRSAQTVKYMVVTRTGVAISAEGHGAVTADDVRNAVSLVNPVRVESLPSAAPSQTPTTQQVTPGAPAPTKP